MKCPRKYQLLRIASDRIQRNFLLLPKKNTISVTINNFLVCSLMSVMPLY